MLSSSSSEFNIKYIIKTKTMEDATTIDWKLSTPGIKEILLKELKKKTLSVESVISFSSSTIKNNNNNNNIYNGGEGSSGGISGSNRGSTSSLTSIIKQLLHSDILQMPMKNDCGKNGIYKLYQNGTVVCGIDSNNNVVAQTTTTSMPSGTNTTSSSSNSNNNRITTTSILQLLNTTLERERLSTSNEIIRILSNQQQSSGSREGYSQLNDSLSTSVRFSFVLCFLFSMCTNFFFFNSIHNN